MQKQASRWNGEEVIHQDRKKPLTPVIAAERTEHYCLQRRYGQADTFGREQGEELSQG